MNWFTWCTHTVKGHSWHVERPPHGGNTSWIWKLILLSCSCEACWLGQEKVLLLHSESTLSRHLLCRTAWFLPCSHILSRPCRCAWFGHDCRIANRHNPCTAPAPIMCTYIPDSISAAPVPLPCQTVDPPHFADGFGHQNAEHRPATIMHDRLILPCAADARLHYISLQTNFPLYVHRMPTLLLTSCSSVWPTVLVYALSPCHNLYASCACHVRIFQDLPTLHKLLSDLPCSIHPSCHQPLR
jgi:hypothetical protein